MQWAFGCPTAQTQALNTKRAWSSYAQRKELIEPIFCILNDQLRASLFLLRDLANARAEFVLLAVL